MSSDTPLVTPEQVKQQATGVFELDELLAAMLRNQQYFYALQAQLVDAQTGGISISPLLQDLQQTNAELVTAVNNLTTAMSGLGGGSPVHEDWNFTISQYDLNVNPWVLSTEGDGFDGPVPDVQGANEVALFIESSDDASFDVEARFVDTHGNQRAVVDSDVDAELSSTSPANQNHYVFVTIAIADRLTDIAITDSSGGQNRINGTMNFH